VHTPAIDQSTTVVVADGQTSTEVGGEQVILDLDAGTYYGLNAVGARVWQLLQSPIEVEALVDTVSEEYEDVSRSQCREDVTHLLADLLEHKLIEVVDET
jgi:hypothetical protein